MSDKPHIAQLGANTRKPASKVNLDVSGTLGPNYLGQETVDVDGHPCDRPGVRSRLPESRHATYRGPNGETCIDPALAEMDTGEELPVLLSSSMSTDPIEGTQGSYTQIVEGECARCGYDRLKVTVVTMAGEHREQCNACGAYQDTGQENDYRMPRTEKERAKQAREAGEKIGETRFSGDIIKPKTDRAYELVGDRGITRLPVDDITALLNALEEHEGFVTNFVHEEMKGKQVKPSLGSDNPNAVDAGIIKERFNNSHLGVKLWIEINREAIRGSDRPVYFSPRADGIAVGTPPSHVEQHR